MKKQKVAASLLVGAISISGLVPEQTAKAEVLHMQGWDLRAQPNPLVTLKKNVSNNEISWDVNFRPNRNWAGDGYLYVFIPKGVKITSITEKNKGNIVQYDNFQSYVAKNNNAKFFDFSTQNSQFNSEWGWSVGQVSGDKKDLLDKIRDSNSFSSVLVSNGKSGKDVFNWTIKATLEDKSLDINKLPFIAVEKEVKYNYFSGPEVPHLVAEVHEDNKEDNSNLVKPIENLSENNNNIQLSPIKEDITVTFSDRHNDLNPDINFYIKGKNINKLKTGEKIIFPTITYDKNNVEEGYLFLKRGYKVSHWVDKENNIYNTNSKVVSNVELFPVVIEDNSQWSYFNIELDEKVKNIITLSDEISKLKFKNLIGEKIENSIKLPELNIPNNYELVDWVVIDKELDNSYPFTKEFVPYKNKFTLTPIIEKIAFPNPANLIAENDGSITVVPPKDNDLEEVVVNYINNLGNKVEISGVKYFVTKKWSLNNPDIATIDENTGKIIIPANEVKDNTEVSARTINEDRYVAKPVYVISKSDVKLENNDIEKNNPSDKDQPKVQETPKVSEQPEVDNTPNLTEQPKVQETPKVTEQPEVDNMPKVTDQPKVQETPKESEQPEVDNMPNLTEQPKVQETPKVTEQPEVDNMPNLTEQPKVQETPKVTEQPEVDNTPNLTEQPKVQETPKVTEQPEVDNMPKVTEQPKVDNMPKLTEQPKVQETPKVTEQPEVDNMPKVTDQPKVQETQKVTEQPKVQETPKMSEQPEVDNIPKVTEQPKVQETPKVTEQPEVDNMPKLTEQPKVQETPKVSEQPEVDNMPKLTEQPKVQETPKVSEQPEVDNMPKLTEQPKVQETPKVTEHPEVNNMPKLTEQPKVQETPKVSEQPEVDNMPKLTEQPKVQETPKVSEQPEVNNMPKLTEQPKVQEKNDNKPNHLTNTGIKNKTNLLLATLTILFIGLITFIKRKYK